MIELLTWPTPNGTKPSIMLEEVGIPYSVRLVNIGSGEQHSKEFLAVSPNGKIPVIVDRDSEDGARAIFESGAILMYLAEKAGALLAPSGPRRDQALSWLFWSMTAIGPTFGQFLHFASSETPPSPVLLRFVTEAVRLVHVLERRLGDVPFLAGDYSIADIGAFTWLKFAIPTIRGNSGDTLGAIPGVDRWLDEINSRPAVQRGVRATKIAVGRAKPAPRTNR